MDCCHSKIRACRRQKPTSQPKCAHLSFALRRVAEDEFGDKKVEAFPAFRPPLAHGLLVPDDDDIAARPCREVARDRSLQIDARLHQRGLGICGSYGVAVPFSAGPASRADGFSGVRCGPQGIIVAAIPPADTHVSPALHPPSCHSPCTRRCIHQPHTGRCGWLTKGATPLTPSEETAIRTHSET